MSQYVGALGNSGFRLMNVWPMVMSIMTLAPFQSQFPLENQAAESPTASMPDCCLLFSVKIETVDFSGMFVDSPPRKQNHMESSLLMNP
jgi:hypothetical protein